MELRIGDEFMVEGARYMLDAGPDGGLVVKRSRTVPMLLGLAPYQYALMSDVLRLPVPNTVSGASRFIAEYKHNYCWPPSNLNGLSYNAALAQHGQIDSIVELFLNAEKSGIK